MPPFVIFIKGMEYQTAELIFFWVKKKTTITQQIYEVRSTLVQNEDRVLIQQIAAYNSPLTTASLNQRKSVLSIGQIFPSAKYMF